mmetsp:Transcript_1832/g.4002  ORF Transcript_1832/g.4002 Transcript_1832/m.4002 type:complete len:473 (+) Transcript_1832:128-1546(+)
MGVLLACVLETPLLFFIQAIAVGALTLTNQLEPAFARSLVVCDVPVQPGQFTGSATCGDRLLVINEGQVLSAWAQSQEHMWRVVALLVVAGTADISGRRPAMLRGTCSICISMMLFVCASLYRPWARIFFVMAQGLQGAFPFDLIGAIVKSDLANRPGADAQSIFTIVGLLTMFMNVAVKAVSVLLQLLEIDDFLVVWAIVFVMSLVTFALTVFYFPETRDWSRKDPSAASTQAASLREEIREYVRVFKSNALLCPILLRDVFANLAEDSSLKVPACMAIFGYTQAQAVARFLFLPLWISCWSSASPMAIRFLGEKVALRCGRIFMQVTWAVCSFLAPVSSAGFWGLVFVPKISYGLGALESAIQSKCLAAEMQAKSISLLTLSTELVTAVSVRMYSALFDATAESYLEVGRPFLVSIAFRMVAWLIFWLRIWPHYAPQADKLQKERLHREEMAMNKKVGDSSSVASNKKDL